MSDSNSDRMKKTEAGIIETDDALPELPSLGKKMMRYSGAVRKWIATGRPSRSEEEVRRIYDTLCKTCEKFDERAMTCKACGCRVRRGEKALTNKIAMATEHCPIERW